MKQALHSKLLVRDRNESGFPQYLMSSIQVYSRYNDIGEWNNSPYNPQTGFGVPFGISADILNIKVK